MVNGFFLVFAPGLRHRIKLSERKNSLTVQNCDVFDPSVKFEQFQIIQTNSDYLPLKLNKQRIHLKYIMASCDLQFALLSIPFFLPLSLCSPLLSSNSFIFISNFSSRITLIISGAVYSLKWFCRKDSMNFKQRARTRFG